jgi:DNA-binding IclR family transcriptional regulator
VTELARDVPPGAGDIGGAGGAVRRAPGSVQSVGRALRVLDAVAAGPDGASARDLAHGLGLTLPTTYHLLTTLIDAGYVVHLEQEHRYALGYKVRMLEQALCRQLAVPQRVADVIRALHDGADAAAYYAVYRNNEVVLVHVVDSSRRPRIELLDVGYHEAAHATAFGKVMLAALDDEQRRSYLARAGMGRVTPRTIVDLATLERQLEHVRATSMAMDLEEFQPGVACLASPVPARGGAVTSVVAVSMPAGEFLQRRWDLERAVRQAATTVGSLLR